MSVIGPLCSRTQAGLGSRPDPSVKLPEHFVYGIDDHLRLIQLNLVPAAIDHAVHAARRKNAMFRWHSPRVENSSFLNVFAPPLRLGVERPPTGYVSPGTGEVER